MISILTCQVESKDDSQEKDGGVDNSSPADESAKVEETKEADSVPKSEDVRMNLYLQTKSRNEEIAFAIIFVLCSILCLPHHIINVRFVSLL